MDAIMSFMAHKSSFLTSLASPGEALSVISRRRDELVRQALCMTGDSFSSSGFLLMDATISFMARSS